MSITSLHSLFWLSLQPQLLFVKDPPGVSGSGPSPAGELGAAGPCPLWQLSVYTCQRGFETAGTSMWCTGLLHL